MITPLATPLLDADTLDCPALEKLIDRVTAGGVDGVFPLGTTGEAQSISYRLRAEVIRRTCDQARGRVSVLAGVTDTAFRESLRMADVAAQTGAYAVVAAPPYYLGYSQGDLYKYVERLSIESPLPLFLYNIPSLTKVGYSPETVRLAAYLPNVLGLKDS